MKKKTAVALLGILAAVTVLAGCGSNEATEAASESAQTEDEGAGDDAEMQEAQEKEEKQKEKESKEKEKDKKETDKEEKASEASKDDKEKALEDASDTEEKLDRIAVLLPDEEEWEDTALELEENFSEDGYEAVISYAEGDASAQTAQISEMLEAEVKAFVITPVDAYGLEEALAPVKEAGIPVFSYDELIMNSNAVKYYTTFGGRQTGQLIANEIVKREELEKLREEKGSKTIEFLMGSQDDVQALFLYNGVMEVLQPYLDDGTLVCRSDKTSFDDTGNLRWSDSQAKSRLADILETSYPEGEVPDIICTGFDRAALAAADAVEEAGMVPGTEEWPTITGVNCEAEAVKAAASGRIAFSIFMDYRELAARCEEMVHVYLTGEEDPEVNDYEQYDNGVKIIGSYLCEAQAIDADNFELLIDNGFYEDEEVRPEATPTPQPTAEPTEEPEPSVSPTPSEEETDSSEEEKEDVTPTPSEEEEETTPTPAKKERTTLKKSKSLS